MVIRVLTFEGCPSCEATRRLVEETVKELQIKAEIDPVQVDGEDEPRRQADQRRIDAIDLAWVHGN